MKAISEVTNEDNMELMARFPDGYFELAIVDPPYGIDADQRRGDTGRNKHIKQKEYHIGNWDKGIPSKGYFEELKRVSKHQIIWGGNYFLDYLNATSCFIIWDKDNGENLYADCEIAWASFETAVRKIRFKWHGFLQGNMANKEERIHPTQKPIALYKWLLQNYAKKGDKILDTHLGSQSSRIAAYHLGFDFWGCELDKDYYTEGCKRFDKAISEPLFDTIQTPVQQTLL